MHVHILFISVYSLLILLQIMYHIQNDMRVAPLPKEHECVIGSDIILLDNTTVDKNILALHTITIDIHNVCNFQTYSYSYILLLNTPL